MLPRKLIQQARAIPASIPAPILGWNARDALGAMEETDAAILTNWYPATTNCTLRYGYTNQSTGLGSQVETLMAYSGGATSSMFGIAGGSIYDCSIAGAVGAAVKSGLSNSRWQYVNVATPAGAFLSLVNGTDAPLNYDGAAWTNPAITGVTSTNLIHVNVWKNRQWFLEKNTLKAWYLPVQSIAGAANAVDMSAYCKEGGYLMGVATWTIDAGYGVDDYLVFITNKGETLVWKGTDPTSSTTFALVGVWRLGSPVGRRCFVKWAGDLLLITQDGLVPLSGALQSSRLNPRVALTDKIQFAISDAVSNYSANFGWQVIPFPKNNQLYLNVPINEGSNQQQYVMNTITKSWCNFTGWAANCWELFNDNLFFGGNGAVCQAWNGLSDNGASIRAEALQAFNYFKSPGQLKRWTMMRPRFLANGSPAINANINVDFDLSNTTAPLSFSPTTYAVWDTAVWDTATWGGGLGPVSSWQGCNGIGYCAAPHLLTAASGIQVQWVSTDLVMERGGIL
jgi:hypothetical protein